MTTVTIPPALERFGPSAIPTVLTALETCDQETAAATIDQLGAAIALLEKVGDVGALTDLKRARRKAQAIVARRWPPTKGRPANGETTPMGVVSAKQRLVAYAAAAAVDDIAEYDEMELDELSDRAILDRARQRKADPDQLGYLGSKPGNSTRDNSDEWYTPPLIIEAVKSALGGTIGLDPYSSGAANATVGAERYFDLDDDALTQEWHAESVFMNPPYGRKNIDPACHKFIDEWEAGRFRQGVILVNNVTETGWAQSLWATADSVALPTGRISFVSTDGKVSSSNTRGQTIFYFGRAARRFERAFSPLGVVRGLS